MEPYQFILVPGQYAELNVNFHAVPGGTDDDSGEEKRIDLIQTGTYDNNNVADRFAKSFAHANVDEPNPPITTFKNTSSGPISYDIRACFKTERSGRTPWTDMNDVYKDIVTPLLYRITFQRISATPGSAFKHKVKISVSVEIRNAGL